jgi:hypothetical protein
VYQLLVAVNGGTPTRCQVLLRTAKIRSGVLCEVEIDHRYRLCLIEQVINDGEIVVRPLPEPPDIQARPQSIAAQHQTPDLRDGGMSTASAEPRRV